MTSNIYYWWKVMLPYHCDSMSHSVKLQQYWQWSYKQKRRHSRSYKAPSRCDKVERHVHPTATKDFDMEAQQRSRRTSSDEHARRWGNPGQALDWRSGRWETEGCDASQGLTVHQSNAIMEVWHCVRERQRERDGEKVKKSLTEVGYWEIPGIRTWLSL